MKEAVEKILRSYGIHNWMKVLTALITSGFLLGSGVAVAAATIDLPNIEAGDAVWCDVTVESLGLVSVNAWTNGSGYDDLELFLYDPAGSELTSDWGSSDEASIDYSASITGTYKVKAVLTEAYGGGTRSISLSSNCALSLCRKYKKAVGDIERGNAIWVDLAVNQAQLVFVNSWSNGSGYDDLEFLLYDPAGNELASEWGFSGIAGIDYIVSSPGTYKIKAYLSEAYGGGTRTISVSSNCPLEQAGPPTSVSLITDKLVYSLGETMTTTVTICSPSQTNVTFQWYWLVPQLNLSLPVLSVQLPGGYDNTINFSFAIPYLGPTPFGNTFYVQLLDASGTILDADSTWSVYSPGAGMQEQDVDITEEIKSIIEGVEFPN
jgi:hypothetical protein